MLLCCKTVNGKFIRFAKKKKQTRLLWCKQSNRTVCCFLRTLYNPVVCYAKHYTARLVILQYTTGLFVVFCVIFVLQKK